MNDYRKQPLEVGDTIRNIESNWRGVIQSVESHNGDAMLVCLGVNWWTGDLDEDDRQWHAPADVVKQRRRSPEASESPSTTNFL